MKMKRPSDAVPPIPEGYHSVTPWIISRDTTQLLDFMKQAFGAEELGRVYNEDGTIGHAEAKIGDCIVMAFDARKEWPATPCFLRLYVPDGDAVYQQALSAGAASVTEMTSMFWGTEVVVCATPLATSGGFRPTSRMLIPRRWQSAPLIHFIHERGKGPNPLPLILTHGWPDSFYRMHKIIPMLTDPESFGGDAADSFDVIVPSIPGFGFSDPVRKPGWTVKQTAELWASLMQDVLGYQRYAAAGGDGGSPISQLLALNSPALVIGIHLTDIGFQATMNLDPSSLTPAEQQYLGAMQQRFFQEGGYIMIQSTKPQTLAYGLCDSPVGLAAWIIEKFYGWSDIDGDIEREYTKDELLTNIMIYWVTQTINPSIRSYYEESHAPSLKPGQRVEVPVAMALFPKDTPPPRALAERTLRIERWTEMPRGGHFPALEVPELYVGDLQAFFRSFR